jgi:hypothetical protein
MIVVYSITKNKKEIEIEHESLATQLAYGSVGMSAS